MAQTSGEPGITGAHVIPTMRYDDASAAIEWLCEAFGFETRMVVDGPDGTIAHAQLVYRNGMIMLGSARNDEFGKLQNPPRGSTATQSAYVVVPDVDAHHERAVAAGAKIVFAPKTEPHGRMYSCLDPQGQLWNFGDYDPWAPV